jgi:hypothetical protein
MSEPLALFLPSAGAAGTIALDPELGRELDDARENIR